MGEKQAQTVVHISLGPNEVRLEGPESFVSKQLDTILDKIDLTQKVMSKPVSKQHGDSQRDEKTKNVPGNQISLTGGEVEEEELEKKVEEALDEIPDEKVESQSQLYKVKEPESDKGYVIEDPKAVGKKYSPVESSGVTSVSFKGEPTEVSERKGFLVEEPAASTSRISGEERQSSPEWILDNESGPLWQVSNKINVPLEQLRQHFYVEEDESGYEVHIQDPQDIPGKFALLGLCTIKEVLTNETYHDNQEMKKKLIDVEKVDIENWGRVFLHRLRKEGLIKDDPNSEKQRNKPFKITPKGRFEFVTWVQRQ